MLSFGRRFDEAEPYIKEIWQLNPKDIRFISQSEPSIPTAGKYEKAAEAYRKSLEIEPNNPGAYLGLAGYYAKLGQIEEAIKAYDKVLEMKPDVPNIMIIYADLLRNDGQAAEAMEMYKRVTASPTNSPVILTRHLVRQNWRFGNRQTISGNAESLSTRNWREFWRGF